MKLVIITAIHNRIGMTKAFLQAMDRIWFETRVPTYAVVSTEDVDCQKLCEHYDIEYVTYKNKPVGEKFNQVVKFLEDKDFTHLMILGSDDIPSTSFIEHCLTLKGDIIGIQGMYFWGLNPRRDGFGRFGYWKCKSLLGAGKIVSRKIVEAVDWQLWPDNVNGGMDGQMMKRVGEHLRRKHMTAITYKWDILKEKVFIIDIKYGLHISSLSPLMRRGLTQEDDFKTLSRYLPENEVSYLMELKQTTTEQYNKKHGIN